MKARLFVIPGSHPSMAARLMLEYKGVEYRRVDLLPPLHRAIVRAVGFPSGMVPALRVDGRRVQGSGAIARWLDEVRPDLPLIPEDPDLRRRVEEADAWQDEQLQMPIRRLTWWLLGRDRSTTRSYLEGARLGIPVPIAARTAAPFIWAAGRRLGVTEETARADLAAIPGLLDHADRLVEEGTIGGERLNVADFQVAGSIRLLMSFEDFREAVERRPCGAHALRVVPEFPGRVPQVLDPATRAAATGGSRDAAPGA
ncbi:MAG: glutathione S-transferase [Actinomycetota bacterium]|nr:glutathione S-transferase [Actinomycetota bacterium]